MTLFIFKKTLYLLTFLIFSLLACHIFDRPKKEVVLTVGNTLITRDELRADIEGIISEMEMTDLEVKLAIKPIIRKVIEKSLIIEYGKEEGITISDNELEAAINDIKKDYPEDAFNEMLLQKYIDFNKWKEDLREDLLIKKVVTAVLEDIPPVSFDETKAYFESHRNEFMRPKSVQVRQIVTRSREEAETILELLAEGNEMDELAKKHSITPEATQGGFLGWIGKGELEEDIEEILFSLPADQKSPVIKSPYGYHIFEVLSQRDEGLKELPEAKPDIESELILQKKESFYEEWIEGLKERFPVTIDEKIYTDWNMEE